MSRRRRSRSPMDPPNRVDGHLSMGLDCEGIFTSFGSRHGLLLNFHETRNQLLVWDPFNATQHRVAVPPEFVEKKAPFPFSGAVFRGAGEIQHFQVVLVGTETDELQHTQVFARVYSSETGAWGDRIPTQYPSKLPTNMGFNLSVLVGHSLYWLFMDRSTGRLDGIVEFDLEMQILAMKPVPVDIAKEKKGQFQVMRAEGSGLGILFLLKFSAQLWKMVTDSDGVASWVLGRTIELDKLLPLDPEEEEKENSEEEESSDGVESSVLRRTFEPDTLLSMLPEEEERSEEEESSEEEEISEDEDSESPFPVKLGFAEYNNVLFLWTPIQDFTIELESMQFKKVSKLHNGTRYFPFESVYAAGLLCAGGHRGATHRAVSATAEPAEEAAQVDGVGAGNRLELCLPTAVWRDSSSRYTTQSCSLVSPAVGTCSSTMDGGEAEYLFLSSGSRWSDGELRV